MENEKKFDSIIIGAVVFAILFIGLGIWGFVTKKNGYFIPIGIGIVSLLYLIYLLKQTKDSKNERYEDERKNFLSEKSKSKSFDILFWVIVIFEFLTSTGKIVVNSNTALLIVMSCALAIQFISYLVHKFKY